MIGLKLILIVISMYVVLFSLVLDRLNWNIDIVEFLFVFVVVFYVCCGIFLILFKGLFKFCLDGDWNDEVEFVWICFEFIIKFRIGMRLL